LKDERDQPPEVRTVRLLGTNSSRIWAPTTVLRVARPNTAVLRSIMEIGLEILDASDGFDGAIGFEMKL